MTPSFPAPAGRVHASDLGTLLAVFIASRAWAWHQGVTFDAHGLEWYFQFLPTDLLRGDLLRSIYYMHIQPPLFNLFLGAVLKFGPADCRAVLTPIYWLFGLSMIVALYALMRRLGVRRPVGLGLTILFAVAPSTILFEHYLFYTYPVTALLLLSAYALNSYARHGRWVAGVGVFSLLAVVALTRSMFHLGWLVAIVLAMIVVLPQYRRRTLIAACLPLLAVVAWYLKNALIFGTFSASTWLGFSTWKSAHHYLDSQVQAQLIQDGVLSPMAEIEPFSPLQEYHRFVPSIPSTGIPVLDRETKGNEANLNHLQYVALSANAGRDAWALLQRDPWGRRVPLGHALVFYCWPASDYYLVENNREHIAAWACWYDRWLLGKVLSGGERVDSEGWNCELRQMGLLLVVLIPLLWVYGCRRAWRACRTRPPAPQRTAEAATLVFICFNVAYVTLVGNAVELGENMRFRFQIDPLLTVLLALLATDLLDRLWPSNLLRTSEPTTPVPATGPQS